jgi:hypothetical protein
VVRVKLSVADKLKLMLLFRVINDMDGPFVAGRVYEELMKKDILDTDDIAYALDAAIAQLRELVPVHRWAPFIHMGA